MKQQSGSTIADFNILEKLGEGSFSSVYKVQRKSDGQYYAMKKVNISQQSFKERENALNEIRILASLDSPYIVEYKDSFLDAEGRTLFVIMEFAQGGDLNSILKQAKQKGGVEESEIWKILTQITLGVKILHDVNILHRDLKLANVFVAKIPEGNIYKIGDLNISKVTSGGNAKTQAGTPYYAAPEVWKGDIYSWPCDIWSIGCITYELAAQQPPFRAGDLQSLNRRIQQGVYDPIPSKYSSGLSEIIKQLLQVNPKNRPNSDSILKNPIVIKNSGSLLVEEESNGRKVAKLLQTIKLPFNLKFLKDNLPKANYENRLKRSNSSAGIRSETEVPQPQPIIRQQPKQEEKKLVSVPSQGAPLKNKPPLIKPPMAQPAKVPYPQTPQQLGQKVQQQEQRLLGKYQPAPNAYNTPSYLKYNQQGQRAQSPRGNPYQQQKQPYYPQGISPRDHYSAGQNHKRQYSAGPMGRR